MARYKGEVKRGFAHCVRGKHDERLSEFYIRANGKPRSWCIACTKSYAMDQKVGKSLEVRLNQLRYIGVVGLAESLQLARESYGDDAEVEDIQLGNCKSIEWRALPYKQPLSVLQSDGRLHCRDAAGFLSTLTWVTPLLFQFGTLEEYKALLPVIFKGQEIIFDLPYTSGGAAQSDA